MLNTYRLVEAVDAMRANIGAEQYVIDEASNVLSVIDVDNPGTLIQESNMIMTDAKLEVTSHINEATDCLIDEASSGVADMRSLVEASENGIINKIKAFFTKIINFFKSLISRIIQFFKDLIAKIKAFFSRKVSTSSGEKTVQQIAKETASGNKDPLLPADKAEKVKTAIKPIENKKISEEITLPAVTSTNSIAGTGSHASSSSSVSSKALATSGNETLPAQEEPRANSEYEALPPPKGSSSSSSSAKSSKSSAKKEAPKAESKGGKYIQIPAPPTVHDWGGSQDSATRILNLPSVAAKAFADIGNWLDKMSDNEDGMEHYSTEELIKVASASMMGRSKTVDNIAELFTAFDEYYMGNVVEGARNGMLYGNVTVKEIVDYSSKFNKEFMATGVAVNQMTSKVDDAKDRFVKIINTMIKTLEDARRGFDKDVDELSSDERKEGFTIINNTYKMYQDYSNVTSNLNTHGIKILGTFMNEMNAKYSWMIMVRTKFIKPYAK